MQNDQVEDMNQETLNLTLCILMFVVTILIQLLFTNQLDNITNKETRPQDF